MLHMVSLTRSIRRHRRAIPLQPIRMFRKMLKEIITGIVRDLETRLSRFLAPRPLVHRIDRIPYRQQQILREEPYPCLQLDIFCKQPRGRCMCDIACTRFPEYMVCYCVSDESPEVSRIDIDFLGEVEVANVSFYRYMFCDFKVVYGAKREAVDRLLPRLAFVTIQHLDRSQGNRTSQAK